MTVVAAIFGLLLIAAATHPVAERIGIRFPIALVLVGIAIAELADAGAGFLAPIARLDVPPSVIFFVFLPTLVFEAALNMDARALRENVGPVLILAVPGLVLSTVICGVLLHLGAPFVGFQLRETTRCWSSRSAI